MDERNDDKERKPGDKFYESAETDDNGNIFHYTITQKAKNISTAMFITLKGFAGTRTNIMHIWFMLSCRNNRWLHEWKQEGRRTYVYSKDQNEYLLCSAI